MEEANEIFKDTRKKSSGNLYLKSRYIITAIVVLFFAITALFFSWFNQKPESDPVSEWILRQEVALQLNKNPEELTDEDYAKITEFELRGKGLCDIKLLSKLTNLQELSLTIYYRESAIPKWMKVLSKLGIYDLKDKFYIDLSPVERLTDLKKLNLYASSVKNIQPLSGLKNLEELILDSTLVADIKPIKELKKLKVLNLCATKVTNIESIKGLVNMKELHLYDTKISDIEPIKDMTNLYILSLRKTPVSNLEPIKGLTNLQFLLIKECNNITKEQIEDVQKVLPKLNISKSQ